MTTMGDQMLALGLYPRKTREDSGFSSKSSQLSPTAPDFYGYSERCASDSGASTGEQEYFYGMKEEVEQGRQPMQLAQQEPATLQMPGSWFYEVGDDCGSVSPTEDMEAELQMKCDVGLRNITQAVIVPSSEHVAEIVGRQGCKIKALRAKTNTYIKTPVRGEEPIFVVTGRPEDVIEAKREIECAAEHFTQIRASRRHSQGGTPAPGHVTAYVRVPLRVVGLVVGPKGATIKRIQQDTHTYIITPSREREPIFEVTGLPNNVELARKEIEQHIYQRTGNMPITDPTASISSYSEMQMNMARQGIPTRNGASSANCEQNEQMCRQQTMGIDNNGMASLMKTFSSMRTGYGSMNGGFGNNAMTMPSNTNSFTPSPMSFHSPNSMKSYNGQRQQEESPMCDLSSYPQWSTSSCLSSILDTADLFSSSRPQFSSFVGGSSVWSSSLGMPTEKNSGCSSQDEGLGDSPTNGLLSMGGASFGNLQTIWSDAGTNDGKKTTSIPLLSV